ncbi:hypothetical protein LCGC14_0388150 [marine sediment metagenome]|uniref:DUF551 domain-containing protein n=1 Tax=marine sediment metagenome TaxID=412755 RepID=A0A0F9W959_9ZZZZ
MEWISVKERVPEFSEPLEITYDGGKTFEGDCAYLEKRHCMMAGIAGGNGYFGEGFGTQGAECEEGLILDTPSHWRYRYKED